MFLTIGIICENKEVYQFLEKREPLSNKNPE